MVPKGFVKLTRLLNCDGGEPDDTVQYESLCCDEFLPAASFESGDYVLGLKSFESAPQSLPILNIN